MFPAPPLPYARLTPEQQNTWNVFLERLDGFMQAQDMEGDPLLIHGTSLLRAGWILRDGFHGHAGTLDRGLAGQVFWTTHVNAARGFAEGRVGMARDKGVDDLPAILTARLSDILAAGTALPDNNYARFDEDERATWQEGLREDGLLKITGPYGGGPIKVARLRLIGPQWRSMPLHPGAAESRAERLSDSKSLQPPPGLEWTGTGPALPWDAIEPEEFGIREQSGRIVLDEDAWWAHLTPRAAGPSSF